MFWQLTCSIVFLWMLKVLEPKVIILDSVLYLIMVHAPTLKIICTKRLQ